MLSSYQMKSYWKTTICSTKTARQCRLAEATPIFKSTNFRSTIRFPSNIHRAASSELYALIVTISKCTEILKVTTISRMLSAYAIGVCTHSSALRTSITIIIISRLNNSSTPLTRIPKNSFVASFHSQHKIHHVQVAHMQTRLSSKAVTTIATATN